MKKSNKRVYLKAKGKGKGKAIKQRETSDEEIDSPRADNRKSDDEENAPVNLPVKKGSNKRARSKPEGKHPKSKKKSVGHKETSNEDGDDLLVEDDRKSDEENALVSPAKKRGSNKRVSTSLKRKSVKGKKRNQDLAGASENEGPHDMDISMRDAENSNEEENIHDDLMDKKGSYTRAPSKFKSKSKTVKGKLASASPSGAHNEEESGDHLDSPMEDDNRSDGEDNPPLEEADKGESDSEEEIMGRKLEILGKTKERSPDSSADEKTELPDDEPLVLAIGPSFEFIFIFC